MRARAIPHNNLSLWTRRCANHMAPLSASLLFPPPDSLLGSQKIFSFQNMCGREENCLEIETTFDVRLIVSNITSAVISSLIEIKIVFDTCCLMLSESMILFT